MKRLIIILDDKAEIDFSKTLGATVSGAKDFKIETMTNGHSQPPIKRHRPGGGKTALTVVMGHFAPSAIFDNATAVKWLKEEGYAANTINSAISELVKAGKLKRLGNSKCQFIAPLSKGLS